jgi:hypothetical protein
MAFAIPALALPDGGPDRLACAFNGNTTQLTTVLPTPNTGTYAFSGSAVCAGADVNSTNDPVGENVSISSSGTYNNTKCGTGSATGSATFTGSDVPPVPPGNHTELPATINYTITFGANGVPGQGTLTVTGGSHGDGTGASGTGALQLSPNQADPDACSPRDVAHAGDPAGDVADDAEAFAVQGAALVTFPDNGP